LPRAIREDEPNSLGFLQELNNEEIVSQYRYLRAALQAAGREIEQLRANPVLRSLEITGQIGLANSFTPGSTGGGVFSMLPASPRRSLEQIMREYDEARSFGTDPALIERLRLELLNR
jgi:hypothetical protein